MGFKGTNPCRKKPDNRSRHVAFEDMMSLCVNLLEEFIALSETCRVMFDG